MIRIFLPPEKLTSEQIIIREEQARYLSLVLRAKPGESLTIFDGAGHRYTCRIIQVHKKEVLVEKIKEDLYSAESLISLTLAQGIPKGDKMDLIIQKSTELGVKKIIPLITERAEVRETGKIERWKKIALSASQQSGRERIPEIETPVSLREFLNPPSPPFNKGGMGGLSGIIFSEDERNQPLKKVLKDFKSSTDITLLIGPEGGFSSDELALAVEKGFTPASLGPRILRTETAPIAAISIIQYELGDIG